MRLATLPIVLALALGSCASEPGPTRAPSDAVETTWTVIASYVNPSLSEKGARAEAALGAALDAAGIRWISAGSAGFSLNVAPEDAEQALAIARRVIAEEGLDVYLVEPRDGAR